MFKKVMAWIEKHPRCHVFMATWLFFGLVVAWVVMVAPFALYDAFKKDFIPYFDGIKEIWDGRNK